MKIDSNGVPTFEETDVRVTQTDCGDPKKDVEVVRDVAGKYHVISGGIVRHPHSSAEDVMRALGWYLQGSLYQAPAATVRCMKAPPDSGPISGEAIAQRMMSICGCKGQRDCDCVSFKNQATRELHGEHNLRGQAAGCNKS